MYSLEFHVADEQQTFTCTC